MSEYEFTKEENQKFAELSVRLRYFSILFGVTSAILVLNGIARWATMGMKQGLPTIIGSLIGVVGAFAFWRPLDNFSNVINTEGQDIAELMTAMKDLIVAYRFMQIPVGLGVIFIFIRLVLLFIS